ncbi:heat shock protein GrpE [Caedimonas varicaedens]|jgi:molecular chaperone GrpE|uniref:Protein GrpE n=1 Tax=Caedimonas varicaedens TaxID=1629334 RepID=A0A0K8MBL4_9PROT|nr:heat shock protein GrpE [Caedimonas varicaedens]
MLSEKDQATALPEKNENVIEENTENEPSSIEQALSIEETLQKEINHMKDQLLRSLAEAENIRKRTQREKEEARQYAVTNFARDLLNIADNLNRALQVMPSEQEEVLPAVKSLMEGVQLTQRELEAIFNRQGIKRISPLGEKFDHNFHQAMFETETEDQEAGIITQVLQDGYVIHDRLLRPAMVGVAKAKAAKETKA